VLAVSEDELKTYSQMKYQNNERKDKSKVLAFQGKDSIRAKTVNKSNISERFNISDIWDCN
jgi:hypothetical protein